MAMVKRTIVIVAGGKGLRMGTDVPKQFLVVNGKPILMHTIERFYEFDPSMQIIVVLPAEQIDYWFDLCGKYNFEVSHEIVEGGSERFFSVRNGIEQADADAELIGIHDGVRPYVSTEVIGRCFDEAAASGAAIPVVAVVETVRELTPDGGSHTVPRSNYRLVQTPQVFSAPLLRKAYAQDFRPDFTDDASVVEAMGHSISLVEGNRENIKITTKADL